MTTPVSPLPDLFPYLVPIGVDIPDSVLRCREYTCSPHESKAAVVFSSNRFALNDHRARYFTADPIPIPRPTPPTDPGTVLLNVTDDDGQTWGRGYFVPDHSADSMPWRMHEGFEFAFRSTSDLVSWTVGNVTPGLTVRAVAEPLDESDHRDRIDSDGDRWQWKTEALKSFPGHHWTSPEQNRGTHRLAEIVGVTFAPEPEPDPLDESDHRDRIIRDDNIDCGPYGITRRQDGLWYAKGHRPKGYTLDDWQNKNGWTITFAPEAN